jgi:hypothetical protein
MSRRTLTRLLFAIFFFLLPVPFLVMGGIAFAPPLRLFGLAFLMTLLGIADGIHGLMFIALAIVLVQTLLVLVALWFFSKLVLFLARSIGGEGFQAPAVAVLGVLLVVASFFPIYTTPISSTAATTNVFEILD